MDSTSVADRYLAELAVWDPIAAQALGQDPHVLVPDLSPEAFAAKEAIAREALTRLSTNDILGAALEDRLEADIALSEAGFTTRLLAPLFTPVHLVRRVIADLPRDHPARIEDNLAAVPAALAGYQDTLRASAARGHIAPRRQALLVARQSESWVDFYRDLPGGQAAATATVEFARFLTNELAPLAPSEDAVGTDLYTRTARAFLGTTIDLADTYAYGWAELRRLSAEIADVAREISPDGVDAAIAELDQSQGPAVLGWLRDRVAATTDALDGTHFDIPPATRNVECHIDATAGVMYYVPPDPQLTRPGRVYWTPDSTATWRAVTTLHHESLPGHHLQHAIAMTQPLHPWQRALCHVHGYAEGWAHYAEHLADELGLITGPAERLGLLLGRMWRAARVVIDIGLHVGPAIPAGTGFTEAETWTPAVARQFLVDVARLDPTSARFEVDRYLGWPAQALAFTTGARLWHEIRAAYHHTDLKRFHMDALRLGPMGLDPLRAALTSRS
ncbi:DUF885 domain-containing protein [Actinocrispum wychmicini]|uniref:Uncharacterized protein (DUF885 family) n=1 Tax=Actinocrispum wychmicini TaxID=1213861 RepID=A0A4R2IJZ2_9PSEU|nr:DUF885 domain-containing protein [Actinocrispum wychmicini]TCO45264.1 uncharacterized protein (DUF885 family) [Actinocrispum wychmicini]